MPIALTYMKRPKDEQEYRLSKFNTYFYRRAFLIMAQQ